MYILLTPAERRPITFFFFSYFYLYIYNLIDWKIDWLGSLSNDDDDVDGNAK